MPEVAPSLADPRPVRIPTHAEYVDNRRDAREFGHDFALLPTLGAAAVVAVAAATAVVIAVLALEDAVRSSTTTDDWSSLAGPLLGIGTFVGVLVLAYRVIVGRMLDRELRAQRWAEAHGFAYETGGELHLPGLIFGIGDDPHVVERVRSLDGARSVEAGTYRYTTGSRKSRTIHEWTYVAVRLEAPLPHLVLDARANDLGGSNLPASLSRHQRLSLEGDFDRWFQLYAPSGYETDALYVFTPDLMALLIDQAGADDVELVDDWMIGYRKGPADLASPEFWERLRRLGVTVADGVAKRAARYRDDRVTGNLRPAEAILAGVAAPPARVATPGRRLRRRVSWRTWVVPVIAAVWIAIIAGRVFG
ncbi:hypothetical protein GE115_16145 [Agromyces sp. CFH 90414]|uniref:DUF3137 domain-containing protein n=1 Tax=Agromyces agglutinans TaxID=2662258 RepID=A0A6I2FL83_9MICO|nr:hypothetical protein [Agromyces agglutinans]MRG61388.1 hypothetical protein [Agromyces agglutinans]